MVVATEEILEAEIKELAQIWANLKPSAQSSSPNVVIEHQIQNLHSVLSKIKLSGNDVAETSQFKKTFENVTEFVKLN